MNTDVKFKIEESAALLHAIFPRYPDLRGMNRVPEVGAFLVALRSQSPMNGEPEKPLSAIATSDSKSSLREESFHCVGDGSGNCHAESS